MSLTDSQLYDLSKKMNFPLERVCFKDELDDEPLVYNKGYIVNMEDEYDANGYLNSGSHWVAFQVNKNPNGTIEKMFFDSYGKPPAVAIEKYTGKIPYSTKNIQSAMSDVCGWFCCAFTTTDNQVVIFKSQPNDKIEIPIYDKAKTRGF